MSVGSSAVSTVEDATVDGLTGSVTGAAPTSIVEPSLPQATRDNDAIDAMTGTRTVVKRRTSSPYPGCRCLSSRPPIPFVS